VHPSGDRTERQEILHEVVAKITALWIAKHKNMRRAAE